MAFILSELVIESTIREGLANVRQDESIINDVFGQLLSLPVSPKYGEKELNKIKKLIKEPLPIVHSYMPVESKVPCISIQLLSAAEREDHASMEDFYDDVTRPMTDEELEAEVIVNSVTIDSYDPQTGIVSINDSTNLSNVHINHVLEDANGLEFSILGGVDNTTGQKQFYIQKQADLETSQPAKIKTIFETIQYEQKINVENETILIGVHTKEPLLTKYLYTLIKYFILSRKQDLVSRCFTLATYEGSDFTRNMEYQSDHVYTRYITVRGRIENEWRADQVIPIDLLELDIRVEKDVADNDDLNLNDKSIKVTDD